MKTSKRSLLFALTTAGAALVFGAPAALAQHGHDEKQPEKAHGAGEKHEAPDTYANAIAEIDERLEAIDGLIKGKKLDKVHAEAQVIVDVASTLAQLALKPGSGVPREAVKDINKNAKELAGKFDAIDAAGDSGDEAGTKKVLAEMVALQATLKKYSPPGGAPGKHAAAGTYSVDLKPMGGTVTPGKPTMLMSTLKDPTGAPVSALETVHEKNLHLLMVSKDLSWFAHEHPEVRKDGTFNLTFTFPAAGDYVLFHDFTPPKAGRQVVQVPIKVEGAAPAAKPLAADADKPKTVDGYTVTLDTGGPVMTGDETHLAYTISKDGKPVTDLAPYLGAMGHLVIISQDLKEFVHSHPHEGGEHAAERGAGSHGHTGDNKGGPRVDFEAHFNAAGLYKGWAQFQHNGKVITVPFTFNVANGEGSGGSKPHEHGK